MKSSLKSSFFACLCTIGLTAEANAALIYDDSLPGATDVDGREMSLFVIADDFMFSDASTLESVKFWSVEGFGARQGGNAWDGTIEYFLFSDAGGAPSATPFASGLGQSITRTFLGLSTTLLDQFNLYHYEFSLESPSALASGTRYWLGLHLASDFNDRDEIYWASNYPQGLGSSSHASQSGTFDNWLSTTATQTFQLFGEKTTVAGPATGWLLLSGFAGLVKLRRRITKQSSHS